MAKLPRSEYAETNVNSVEKRIFECDTVYDFTKVEKVAEEAQVSKKISGASNKIYKTKAR